MNIEVTLQQPAISSKNKLVKILLANSIILGATFVGFKYVPAMINLDPRYYGRLMVLVAMAPVLALVVSVAIGVKQPRHFSGNTEGITLGETITGSDFFRWSDISEFNLCPNSKVLKLRVDSQQLNETLKLKHFGISQQQVEQLQQLAIKALNKE